MFETADIFFASLGLEKVPNTFWNLSMLENQKEEMLSATPQPGTFMTERIPNQNVYK